MTGSFRDLGSVPGPTIEPHVHVRRALDEMLAGRDARTPKAIVAQVVTEIQEFERALGQDHELAMRMLGSAANVAIRVREIRAYDSGLIVLDGTAPDDTAVRVVQHVTQMSFGLEAVPGRNGAASKRPVGFHVIPD